MRFRRGRFRMSKCVFFCHRRPMHESLGEDFFVSKLLFDTLVTGLPLVPAVLGIYVVFRLRSDFDLTIDASFTMGGILLTVGVAHDVPAWPALLLAALGAGAMGLVTAGLHLALRVPVILAGLVMSIGFYSVGLRSLGLPSQSLAGYASILDPARRAADADTETLLTIAILGALVIVVLIGIGALLRTEVGLALRSTGLNPLMARSHGVNDRAMVALSLFLANGLAGLSGALVVQNQRFVDVNMGAGTLIAGIGAVLLGDLLLRPTGSKVLRIMVAVLVGALVYRFVLVGALRLGVPATDLKGVTALILVAALVTERFLRPILTPLNPRPLLSRRVAPSPQPEK